MCVCVKIYWPLKAKLSFYMDMAITCGTLESWYVTAKGVMLLYLYNREKNNSRLLFHSWSCWQNLSALDSCLVWHSCNKYMCISSWVSLKDVCRIILNVEWQAEVSLQNIAGYCRIALSTAEAPVNLEGSIRIS